ncbi:MAG: deoxyribose-phosphate aldolase [Candidatus Symbiothrix sp.]|jgi:deoxyribose-phosphate aldolase|nr:deoxyribose-phosphate aldolase [Candidatus Symbiothrix sp.]
MDKYQEILSKFDLNLDEATISKNVGSIVGKSAENHTAEVLKFLYSCIDLTSLGTEDSEESIFKFVESVNNFDSAKTGIKNVAGICVYPNFVATVKDTLRTPVRIVSVAGGFPSAQTFMEIKVAEVSLAIADGADEIDMVLNCGQFLSEDYEVVCDEIREIRDVCGDAVLKVILETGLLKTSVNIKKAAILAMYSGADFIKTSTGKVYPGATPEAVYVMCETIKEYHKLHNKKIGIKIAGGVRSAKEAIDFYTIVKEVLGEEWLTPDLFRIGASSLAGAIKDDK